MNAELKTPDAAPEEEVSTPKLYYASTWKRYFALLIDAFIVTLITLPFVDWKNFVLLMQTGEATFPITSVLMPLIIGALYQVLFVKYKQATPGKMAFSLKVVNYDEPHSPLSWQIAILRYLSLLANAVLGSLLLFFAFFYRDRRHMGDLMAGTIVLQPQPRRKKTKVRWIVGGFLILGGLINAFSNIKLITQSKITSKGIYMKMEKPEVATRR
jgi:uncharacterized RDD family membrane protein YckC